MSNYQYIRKEEIGINTEKVNRILSDTAYIRTAGSREEFQCAEYIRSFCADMGMKATIEPFKIKMYEEETAILFVDDKEICCKGYFGAGNGNVKAELYYLEGTDNVSLSKCKDKIVLTDKPVGYRLYDKLIESGAKAFITYSGSIRHDNKDIDRKRIGFKTNDAPLIPGVNIHISDALDIVKRGCRTAEISLKQTEYIGTSHNVMLDLCGESQETVIISAHYDSTSLSEGAYDNMSGCIGLLYLAEYFASRPRTRNIRLLWCGSEETGLIGSMAYCRAHEDELRNTVLNINLDMLGCVMGGFNAFSCADESMELFLKQFGEQRDFAVTTHYGIRSSDSNSFVNSGVPAVSFARYSAGDTGLVHTRYDTAEVVSAVQLLEDMDFIAEFTDRAVNPTDFPPTVEISEKIRLEVEDYMSRKADLV